MKILLVDDEFLEIFISKKILGTEFQVEGFTTVADAMQWAKGNSFDVLVSDYYLDKGLSANDLLKSLIELKGKTFKAFVLTNYIDADKVAVLKQAGFIGIIDKPLEISKFKTTVGL